MRGRPSQKMPFNSQHSLSIKEPDLVPLLICVKTDWRKTHTSALFCVSPGKLFGLQLVVWGLRGVASVILANNPLSGVLILASVYWASPWQGLLGTLGTLISTLTAIIMGQDR